MQANWLYAFIGALPRTDWLGDSIARDDQRLHPHRTRRRVARRRRRRAGRCSAHRSCSRRADPACSPSAMSGSSSMKRVASAVGEGSSAVSLVHLYLETV